MNYKTLVSREANASLALEALVLLIFLLLLHGQAFAGAWVQEKGQGLSITTFRWYESDDFWDQSNHLHEGSRYRKLEINPYLEYGVTEKLTAGFNVFVPDIQASGQGSNFGLGDFEIFARYRLWKSDVSTVSTQVLLKIPEAYDHNELPLIGQGQYDVEWRMLYGHSWTWGKHSWFVNAEGGVRKRVGPPADEIRLDWMIGWKSTGEKWEIDFRQENIIGLRNNEGMTLNDPFREQSTDYDLYKATLCALYWVNQRLGLQAGVTQDIYGRNTGRGFAPFAAAWIRF